MPFRVHCPTCQTAYNCPDDFHGADIRCRKCRRAFRAGGETPADAGPVQSAKPRREAEAAVPPEPAPARRPVVRRRRSLLLTLAICGFLALLLLCGAGALGVYYIALVAIPRMPAVAPPGNAVSVPAAPPALSPLPAPGRARFVIATRDPWAAAAVADIMGLPPDGNFRSDYVFVGVRSERGPPPPEGPYRLAWGGVNFQDGSYVGSGGDPVLGPFMLGEIVPGSRLSNLTPLCVFEARSRGNRGEKVGFGTAPAPMRYTLFEGTVGRSPMR